MKTVLLALVLMACGPKAPVESLSAEAAAAAAVRETISQLWNYEDPGVSHAKFEEAAAAAPDPMTRDQYVTQQARAKGLLGNYDVAHAMLDGIEDPQGLVKVRVLLERGRVFRSAGDQNSAMPLFRDAWELAREVGDDALAVDAAHMAAISSHIDDAIGWTETGLALARESKDPGAQRWIGPLTNNLGWSYHEDDRFEEALASWNDCLAWNEAEKTGQGERVARWTVARGMRSLGRYEEALAIQLTVLIENKENREPTGFVHEELAENYLALGKETQATRHFVKAYDALRLDAHLKAKEPARLRRLRQLAGK
ncbi:MAG: hypothetical protein KC912_15560 [Proteobacteria bacterium]|nr:hypothetical protein [Pseudomonadota bacterium]